LFAQLFCTLTIELHELSANITANIMPSTADAKLHAGVMTCKGIEDCCALFCVEEEQCATDVLRENTERASCTTTPANTPNARVFCACIIATCSQIRTSPRFLIRFHQRHGKLSIKLPHNFCRFLA